MKKMKAKGYSRGGAPTTRAQRRSTLSKAQKNLLDSVQGREGSKQSTSVIQDLSDQYGYKPGKRAGAKGGMGGRRKAKPGGMNMGGTVGMKPIDTTKLGALPPSRKVPAMATKAPLGAPGTKRPSTMRSGPREEKLAAAKKATAMRGAAARRSGGSTPRGMNTGGAAMKTKGYAKGGAAMKTKGAAKGGIKKPSAKKTGLFGRR